MSILSAIRDRFIPAWSSSTSEEVEEKEEADNLSAFVDDHFKLITTNIPEGTTANRLKQARVVFVVDNKRSAPLQEFLNRFGKHRPEKGYISPHTAFVNTIRDSSKQNIDKTMALTWDRNKMSTWLDQRLLNAAVQGLHVLLVTTNSSATAERLQAQEPILETIFKALGPKDEALLTSIRSHSPQERFDFLIALVPQLTEWFERTKGRLERLTFSEINSLMQKSLSGKRVFCLVEEEHVRFVKPSLVNAVADAYKSLDQKGITYITLKPRSSPGKRSEREIAGANLNDPAQVESKQFVQDQKVREARIEMQAKLACVDRYRSAAFLRHVLPGTLKHDVVIQHFLQEMSQMKFDSAAI